MSHSPFAFRRQAHISLSQVDAAGVIFFPKIYEIAQHTLEAFILSFEESESKGKGKSKGKKKQGGLAGLVQAEKLVPLVVQSRAEYFKPIAHSDNLDVHLCCDHIGRSSFVLSYQFFLSHDLESVAATAKVVHTAVDFKTRRPKNLSENWKKKLLSISSSAQV